MAVNTEIYVAGSGQGLTWGNAFSSATLASLAAANGIVSDIIVDNGTALDIFADVSLRVAGGLTGGTPAVPNYVALFIYPLNQDNSTYGDGRFATATGVAPPGQYWVGNFQITTTTGSDQEGMVRGIIMPPGKFKFLIYLAFATANFPASGVTCLYRTYNRKIS